jgi:hypothetical protein
LFAELLPLLLADLLFVLVDGVDREPSRVQETATLQVRIQDEADALRQYLPPDAFVVLDGFRGQHGSLLLFGVLDFLRIK